VFYLHISLDYFTVVVKILFIHKDDNISAVRFYFILSICAKVFT
jgi:hypothetical protein